MNWGNLEFRELIAKAEEKTGGRPDGELQEKLSALPDDEEELQQEMLKLRAEADGIACANPRVVSIYKIHCTMSHPWCSCVAAFFFISTYTICSLLLILLVSCMMQQ